MFLQPNQTIRTNPVAKPPEQRIMLVAIRTARTMSVTKQAVKNPAENAPAALAANVFMSANVNILAL